MLVILLGFTTFEMEFTIFEFGHVHCFEKEFLGKKKYI